MRRKAFKRLYGCSQNMAELSQTSVAEHADLPKRKEMEAIADKVCDAPGPPVLLDRRGS